jgi:hypothetical protein
MALADGRPGADGTALPLYADAAVLAGAPQKVRTVRQSPRPGRVAYPVTATGAVTLNHVAVNTRDGATITSETDLDIVATEDAEIVLADVVGDVARTGGGCTASPCGLGLPDRSQGSQAPLPLQGIHA